MLTREHAIIAYDRTHAHPDKLGRRRHGHYPELAQACLEVYRGGRGQQRRELHRQIREVFREEEDCPDRRIEAFCKLLDDVSVFDRPASQTAPRLRQRLWTAAAAYHPLVEVPGSLLEQSEAKVKELLAAEFGQPWEQLTRDLWADVMECQRLHTFTGYPDAQALLSRYNVAQYQAALFNATDLKVTAREDLKVIVRAAKLAGLMLEIKRLGKQGYEFTLAGAASGLRDTKRYGVTMAKFLPSLLACRDWKLEARLMQKNPTYRWLLEISPETGLQGQQQAPEEFDSKVERAFWERWHTQPRPGWRISRESELVWRAQTVFVPDFTLTHESGLDVHMEIVGFWTPEYIEEKVRKLTFLKARNLLLVVQEKAWRPEFGPHVLRYKTAISVKEVLAGAEAFLGQDHPSSSAGRG